MIKIIALLCLWASIFSSEKWIVVTTIQYPTPQLHKLSQIPGWKLVVVGDKKTPADWHLDHCEYLSPQRQIELGYELSTLLPWNHYSRKNIGYLFAIENGAKVIYETDDDNVPFDGLNFCPSESVLACLISDELCVNIYSYFGHPEIWPRGFPLEKIGNKTHFDTAPQTSCKIGIEQGVVNGSPDVDAIFRLTQDRLIKFDPKPPCYLPQGVFCPFNSQNTFFHEIAFSTLYLPSTVSMRVSDIWRGYIAQKMIWSLGAVVAFSGPNAEQDRNEHNLMHDFNLEMDLYLKGMSLAKYLGLFHLGGGIDDLYDALTQQKFFEEGEALLVKAWLRDLNRVSGKHRGERLFESED